MLNTISNSEQLVTPRDTNHEGKGKVPIKLLSRFREYFTAAEVRAMRSHFGREGRFDFVCFSLVSRLEQDVPMHSDLLAESFF